MTRIIFLTCLFLVGSFTAHAKDAKQLWLEAEAAAKKPTVAVGKWEAVVKAIPQGQTAGEGLTHEVAKTQLLEAYLKAARANKDKNFVTKAQALSKGLPLHAKVYADIVAAKTAITLDKKMALKILKSAKKNAMQVKDIHKRSEFLHSISLALLTKTKKGSLLFGWDGPELVEEIAPHVTLGSKRAQLLQMLAPHQQAPTDSWGKKLHDLVKVSGKKNEKKRNKALIKLSSQALDADKFMVALNALVAVTDRSMQQKRLYSWFKDSFDDKQYSRAATISNYIEDGKYGANSWGKLGAHYASIGETVRAKDAIAKSYYSALSTRREDRRMEALLETADYAGEANQSTISQRALQSAAKLQSGAQGANSEKMSRANAQFIKALAESNRVDEARSKLNNVKLANTEHLTIAVAAIAKEMAENGQARDALSLLTSNQLASGKRLDNAYYAVAKALAEKGDISNAEKAAARIANSKDKIKIQGFIKSKRSRAGQENSSNSALEAPFFSELTQQLSALPSEEKDEALVELAELFLDEKKLPFDQWRRQAKSAKAKDQLLALKAINMGKHGMIEESSRLMRTVDDPMRRTFAFRRLAKEISLHTDLFGFIGGKKDPLIEKTREQIYAGADATQIDNKTLEARFDKYSKQKEKGLEMAAPKSSELGLVIPEYDFPERLEFDYEHVKAKLPPLTPFAMHEVYYENTFFINTKFKITIAYSDHNLEQGIVTPAVLYIERGSTTLPMIYDELHSRGLGHYISRNGKEYTLNNGLLIGPDATLTIDGNEVSKLYLSQQHSSILVNAGNIYVTGTSVVGWDQVNKKPAYTTDEFRYDFRPFLASWSRSHTYLAGSEFIAVGYSNHKSYGISLSAGPEKLQLSTITEPQRPDGIIVDNSFDNVYYGFYSYEADNVALIGNEYRNNIIYGIDPHDRSNYLTMAYNTAYGAHKKHGIIISREVNNSSFVGNLSFDNKGSGFMIDRLSTGTFVYGNTAFGNKQDGLTVFESSCNYIASNNYFNNKSMGIRIRNSQDNGVFFNQLTGNRQGGVMGYISELLDDPAHRRRNFTLDPYADVTAMTVIGNKIESNGAGIMGADLTAVMIRGNHFADQSPRLFSGEWFTDHSYFTSQYDISSKGVFMGEKCPKGKWIHHSCRFRKDGFYDGDGQHGLEKRVVNSSCKVPSKQDKNV